MGINKNSQELAELTEAYDRNLDQRLTLTVEMGDYASDDPRLIIILSEYDDLTRQGRELRSQISVLESRYNRPNGWITGIFSKFLGPLPEGMTDTKIDTKAEKIMATLPSYWWSALGLVVAVVSSITLLANTYPQLLISPLSISMDVASVSSTSQSNVFLFIFVAFVALIAAFALRSWRKTRLSIYSAAHAEKKWFRAGAENWSMTQRAVSCVSFGFCHVINLFYPLVSLLVLSLCGVAFLAAYLAEYRCSQDSYRATLASTKLHARYNIFAFSFMLLVLVFLVISTALGS